MLKRLSGLVRSYFNARFEALVAEVRELRQQLAGNAAEPGTAAPSFADAVGTRLVEAVREPFERQHDDLMGVVALLGRSVDQTADAVAELRDRLDGTSFAGTPAPAQIPGGEPGADHPTAVDLTRHWPLEGLDRQLADIANYALSHNGWAAQAGLWFNPPVSIEHQPGRVILHDVNERVGEVPFVYAALGALPRGSRILDIGGHESTVALGLASLGHRVTVADPHGYPLTHPNLTVAALPVQDLAPEELFDAAVLLSSLEHIGVGAYDLPVDDEADFTALAAVWAAVRPGGTLVLTTPYGHQPTTALQRTYPPERLERLLAGRWDVVDRTYVTKTSPAHWQQSDEVADLAGTHVVLVKATRVDA